MENEANDEERAQQFNLEFGQLKLEGALTFQKIMAFLTQKSGKPFNRLLLNEIFSQIGCDESSSIFFEDFLTGYLKTEQHFRYEIGDLKREIGENQEKMTSGQIELIQSRSQPSQSLLIITINHGKITLQGLNLRKVQVKVICQKNSFSTKSRPVKEAHWDETFTITLSNTSGKINFQVVEEDLLIGEALVDIENYEDQKKHLETFQIFLNGKVRGEITATLQLVNDKTEYLEKKISEIQEKNVLDTTRLHSFEKFLNDLVSPISSTTGSISAFIDFKAVEEGFSRTMDQVTDKVFGEEANFSTILLVCTYLFMLLSVISCFFRPDFFNVISI